MFLKMLKLIIRETQINYTFMKKKENNFLKIIKNYAKT